jgi:septin family protein
VAIFAENGYDDQGKSSRKNGECSMHEEKKEEQMKEKKKEKIVFAVLEGKPKVEIILRRCKYAWGTNIPRNHKECDFIVWTALIWLWLLTSGGLLSI